MDRSVPQANRITSRRHAVVRAFRAAASGEDVSAVLLDGEHLLRDALAAGVRVLTVLDDGSRPDLVAQAAAAGAEVFAATRPVLEAASPVRTPSGVVALVSWTPAVLSAVFAPAPALAIGLVDVQDPGNVGSTIRSSDALGATGVVAVGTTANPGGWKALRGSMGSLFRLPVARASLRDVVDAARQAGARLIATGPAPARSLADVDLRAPACVLFGHEGLGLPDEAVRQADEVLSIPMRPGVDSLNVAVAAALVLAEAGRQRRGASS
jgi:TrmH family RNA methyltransferase